MRRFIRWLEDHPELGLVFGYFAILAAPGIAMLWDWFKNG